MTYSTGYCNPAALETSTYEVPMDAGPTCACAEKLENNYYLAESTFSNTYEYVRGGPYSEVVSPEIT